MSTIHVTCMHYKLLFFLLWCLSSLYLYTLLVNLVSFPLSFTARFVPIWFHWFLKPPRRPHHWLNTLRCQRVIDYWLTYKCFNFMISCLWREILIFHVYPNIQWMITFIDLDLGMHKKEKQKALPTTEMKYSITR